VKTHSIRLDPTDTNALSRSSANRSEATLISISRDVGHSKETSLSLDRQLSEIQRSLSKTHHAILSQSTAVNCILQSISSSSRGQLRSTEQRSSLPWHTNKGFLEAAIDSVTSQSRQYTDSTQHLPGSAGRREQSHEREPVLEGSTGFAHVFSGSMLSPEPASLFEVSRNFFPEIYTTDQRLPLSCLVVIGAYEKSSSGDSKTNIYRLFYLKSPRQWCRLSISIKIHRSSMYWAATKTSQDEYNTRETLILVGAAPLPYSLLTKIQEVLLEAEDFDEDANLRFSLSDQESIQKQYHESQIDLFPINTESLYPCQEILTFLDDLGCSRYFENEVTQIEMLDPPSRFAACINGMLVYETKFACSVPSSELLYNIQLLHCMNGVCGFAKLVGIVVDTTGKHLKSYLIEFPRARWSVEQVTQDQSIPWKRREKWAKQLVQGVSQIHSKGFVVGTLCSSRSPVLIDSPDCVQFWCFKRKFAMGYRGVSYYPPEFRHFRSVSPTTSEAKGPNVTSKTDVFHLGLILWLLAENVSRTHNSPVCMREGCNAQVGPFCDKSHVDPIALPRLPESIPQYYRDVVDACRAEDPNDRPAAWRLLELFPSTSKSESFQIEDSKPESMEISVLGKVLLGTVTCDHCRKRNIQLPFFHCNDCRTGDFDICQACYNRGTHCYDRDHFLVEMRKIGSWTVAGKYHSSVKSSGNRDMVEL
jgi:hypothetical protein